MDEMGPLETIPRGGGSWGRTPARRPDRYRRNGTIQMLAAFAPHLGRGMGRCVHHKTGMEILRFLSKDLLKSFPRGRIHLIMDNLSAHKIPAILDWQSNNSRRIVFHWLPTNSSWLNLIEPWFAVLEKTALHNTYLKTTGEIQEHLMKGIRYLNEHPRPYTWN